MRGSCLFLVLVILGAPARAAGGPSAKAQALDFAFLAEAAGRTCPDLEADHSAIAGFLAHAGVSADDLRTGYAEATRSAGEAFVRSATRDRAGACAQVWDHLGGQGLGLVTRTDGDEDDGDVPGDPDDEER